jgi:hypothetical protein
MDIKLGGDEARLEGKLSADPCEFVFERRFLPVDLRPASCRALAASRRFAVVRNGSTSLAFASRGRAASKLRITNLRRDVALRSQRCRLSLSLFALSRGKT